MKNAFLFAAFVAGSIQIVGCSSSPTTAYNSNKERGIASTVEIDDVVVRAMKVVAKDSSTLSHVNPPYLSQAIYENRKVCEVMAFCGREGDKIAKAREFTRQMSVEFQRSRIPVTGLDNLKFENRLRTDMTFDDLRNTVRANNSGN